MSIILFPPSARAERSPAYVGEVLKQRKSSVRVIAVEPANAAILSGDTAGNHQIPGIGIGFIADIMNRPSSTP